jgi:alpha-N-arabinofuranosidase
MPLRARIRADLDYTLGDVDPRLYGGFVEHLGRHIYTGIFEPGHPSADANGFRQDVLTLLRELKISVIRYPGGNFVSGYDWRDGIGRLESRPARLDLAWQTLESNRFGTNEFLLWCRELGAEPMLAVNLGTKGPEEARQLVEYVNHPSGTGLSDERRSHGYEDPWNVLLWCLGNEMDGPWQMGHADAATYATRARQASDLIKWTSPGAETIVCGSSGSGMATFAKWEHDVLMHCYDAVEYVSSHAYYGNASDDTASFFASSETFREQIEGVVAVCDAVGAIRKSKKKLKLSFDEYNVWYHSHGAEFEKWTEAPRLLEDIYTAEDAVVLGTLMIELINHCDRVGIACLAQLVNVIGPVMTEPGGPAWRQTIFYPFRDASTFGRGTALRLVVDSPTYDANARKAVPVVAAAATVTPDTLCLFLVNRSLGEVAEVELDLGAMPIGAVQGVQLVARDLKAKNSLHEQDRVVPEPMPANALRVAGGKLTAQLEPASWSRVQLKR